MTTHLKTALKALLLSAIVVNITFFLSLTQTAKTIGPFVDWMYWPASFLTDKVATFHGNYFFLAMFGFQFLEMWIFFLIVLSLYYFVQRRRRASVRN